MKYLKRYEDLILEKSTLTQLGVPYEFMKYLQKRYEIKNFNPEEFRVHNLIKSEVKKLTQYPKNKSILVIDKKEDIYYFLRPSSDWKSVPYIQCYSKGKLLLLSGPHDDDYKDLWNNIFKNPKEKEYYVLPWRLYTIEQDVKSKDKETIKMFIDYFNENVEYIIEKILRKEWYKIKDYVIEYISYKSKDIESFKDSESKSAIEDLTNLSHQMGENFKLYLSNKYWEFPIQKVDKRDDNLLFQDFLKDTMEYDTKNATEIAAIINKVGYMKLATLFATYLLKEELKKFEDVEKKYSLSSIEAEKFNF